MPYRSLFFSGLAFLTFLPTLCAEASRCSEDKGHSLLEKHTCPIACYLQDLEEKGYCVISEVLSRTETEKLYERIWHEFIEKAWPQCKMNDRSNWEETFPMHNTMGIFAGPAGQIQVMWDLRQDPRIIDIFARVWNTHDLIVSMDGISLMCPPEIREGHSDPWPHVDQAVLRNQNHVVHSNQAPSGFRSESLLKTEPYTIQGQFLFEDSFEGDGGFYCIPKSHLRFTEFAPQLEEIADLDLPHAEKRKKRCAYLDQFFSSRVDDLGNPYVSQHVTAPRGSLILWDSRTLHWNQHPSKERASSPIPKVRMVGYLCYVPKSRLKEEGRARRIAAFEKGVSTGHNPTFPEHKYTKDHIDPQYIKYLEDPGYKQPLIHLTSTGEALLGL